MRYSCQRYIDEVAKDMAIEMIKEALDSLGAIPTKVNYEVIAHERRLTLLWFKERDQHIWGYGWCLVHSNCNPNAIRKLINGYEEQWTGFKKDLSKWTEENRLAGIVEQKELDELYKTREGRMRHKHELNCYHKEKNENKK